MYDQLTMWLRADLREIRVFLTLADELHFGRTAERLGVTTSYVSQMIHRLEDRVGGRLFDRTSRRVSLTALGGRLLASGGPAYRELERALQDVRETATGVVRTLRIGSYSPTTTGPHWVAIVKTFETRNPGCRIEFVHLGLERNYLDSLRSRDVELLAVRLPLTEPDVTVGPILSREQRMLAVAVGDPLAQQESVSVEDLAERAVTDVPAFPREMMDTFIPPSTPSGRRPRRVANRTLDEALMRVAVGEQVHPTTPSWLEYHRHPDITGVPIRDLPSTMTALAWLTENTSARIRAFAEVAEDVLARHEQAAQTANGAD